MTTAAPPSFPGFAPAPGQQQPFGAPQSFAAPMGAPQQPFGVAPIGPGMAPMAPPMMAQPAVAFVLNIAPDPTWEPMEMSDTLEKDGYYAGRVTSEKLRKERDGVFFTISLLDPDVAGKSLSKLMLDPNQQKSDIWFTWRNLIRSVTGTLDAARQGLQYTVGMFVGQTVYFKTAAYGDKSGNLRTGVDSWVTKAEWEEAARSGRNRWVSKAPVSAGVGALPTGAGGFPAAPGAPGGFPAFPGTPAAAPAPSSPMQAPFPMASTPQPSGAPIQQPPMQAAPPPVQYAQPPAQQPPQQFAPAQPAPVAAPAFAPPAPSFSFAPPQNGASTPQPGPTAAGIATSFPGAR